jgi:hypothetical protein
MVVFGKVVSALAPSTATVSFLTATRDDLDGHNGGTPRRINRIDIDNGPKCTYFELSQSYFTDGSVSSNFDRRLKLDAIQKKSCTSGSSESEEPYTFTYHGGSFFPSLLSKAIDHWGYYNGETGNDSQNDLIPQSTSITTLIGGYNLSHGSALRDTDEAEMIKGSLQRITYPTKGYTEYTYEANSYIETENDREDIFPAIETCAATGGSCCGNNNTQQDKVLTQAMINTGILTLTIQNDGTDVLSPIVMALFTKTMLNI